MNQETRFIIVLPSPSKDNLCLFHTDVTFEMRTVRYLKVFIQLMSLHTIRSSFISKQNRGQEGKIAERKRGRDNEHRLAADVASVVKLTIRKYTCLTKQDGQHLARLLLISNMRNLANDISHN